MATNLDPVDLSLLVNIRRTQSITGAARAINICLSAASTRIKKLESLLNVQILYRESDGVRFTPAGLLILEHADLVLGSGQRLIEDLEQMARSGSHLMRIRATSQLITETLPSVIGVYRSTHPNVFFEIKELVSESIVDAIQRGDADIGIASTDGDTEGLVATPYYQDRFVLIVHGEHEFADRDEMPFVDALDYSFVGLGDSSTSHQLVSAAARALKRGYHRRTVVGSFEAICCMVAARIGLGIVPRSAARRYSRTVPFKIIDLTDDWTVRNYSILQRRGELVSYAQQFIKVLLSEQKPCPDIPRKSATTELPALAAPAGYLG
jgi:DNA-binding transcriptional LysR family regulator